MMDMQGEAAEGSTRLVVRTALCSCVCEHQQAMRYETHVLIFPLSYGTAYGTRDHTYLTFDTESYAICTHDLSSYAPCGGS
jgi:hypothetical protein